MSIVRYKLMLLFPSEHPREVAKSLLKYNTHRAVAALLGVSTYSVYIYGEKCGVYRGVGKGHPARYQPLVDMLGENPKEALTQLKEEYKTWRTVSFMIGIKLDILREFRRRIKLIHSMPGREVVHKGDALRRFLAEKGLL